MKTPTTAAGSSAHLSEKAASSFDASVRSRGEAYARRRRVKVSIGTKDFVDAVVRGSQNYSVMLSLEDGELVAFCTCPYFGGVDLCKHVWATLLCAEAEGHLADAARRRGPLSVVPAAEDEIFPAEDGDEALGEGAVAHWERAAEADEPWEHEVEETGGDWRAPPSSARPRGPRPPPRRHGWRAALASLTHAANAASPARYAEYAARPWPAGQQILYMVGLVEDLAESPVTVETWVRRRKANGAFGNPSQKKIAADEVARLPDADDRRILSLLHGASEGPSGWHYGYGYRPGGSFCLSPAAYDTVLPLLCATGRCHRRATATILADAPALEWDAGPPWEMWVEVRRAESRPGYVVEGSLRRDGESIPISEPETACAPGLVLQPSRIARLDDGGAYPWIPLLRSRGRLAVPANQGERLVEEILGAPAVPRLQLPPALTVETARIVPRPHLHLKLAPQRWSGAAANKLYARVSFDYDGVVIERGAVGAGRFDRTRRRWIARDPAAERAAFDRLLPLGVNETAPDYERTPGSDLRLARSRMPAAVQALLAEGWHVEAEGKLYRNATFSALEVVSGIDWFELHGRVKFDDVEAPLPALLAALRKGEGLVTLGDGTVGVLPEEWLRRFGFLAGFGTERDDHVRFGRSQVGVLDALLAAQPEARCDEVFARAREQFRRFSGVAPRDPSRGFSGTLRPYQQDGLGWLDFLRRFGFGGILADDMGLGKTVQVLALLEERREALAQPGAQRPGPSLVVVPRSLVFNWRREAARFAPQLRVLEHLGSGRTRGGNGFGECDLVVTTYGTLRRDITHLTDVRFDWAILDEAQAIKNARTATAKAARLLSAEHRLALSGTPIENHLGELWSLFEFLNPGMLGSASAFASARAGTRDLDEQGRALLARAVRPFVLRRTKDQVARDLPSRQEQTIYADLDRDERRAYDELRDHYRRSLLSRVAEGGLAKAKIQVLEALLRLRQAACHPGLIDKSRRGEPSAKLEILLAQLGQVLDEGHKALVFSQFTSFLAIARSRLDREHVTYEYLDGKTRDREARVERFQTDPECRLFLISLKAGGLGLNLTAAEYVYLLDPWWNPAVEAQAIDRSHRIGQTRQVFAYRLIARETVEEKVLELQKSKRALADAIIGADNAPLRDLTREDLELLLS
jgi:superfamily II DNA or RNA helicase